MNIEPLYELKERLNTSAVAGISLMPEDFRLKRAIEQMEPLAKAVPIFAKIYQGALHMLEAKEEERADILLDELALVDAVLVTQAAVGIDGELSIVPAEIKENVITDAPYSKVAPALEALTTTGSGHYAFLVEMHKESPESFRDFRLRSALVDGLGAGYSELAEQVEQWLMEEDESILPYLKQGFQGDGKKEMVRRIHIVEKIAGAKENDWYIAMLDTAQKEVRETLIYALRHEKKNEELLFNLIKTEKSAGKRAAIWALTRMDSEAVYEYFRKQLGFDEANSDIAVVQRRAKTLWEDGYFYLSKSDQVSDLVAKGLETALDFLEEQVKNGECLLEVEKRRWISQMLSATIGKTSDAMLAIWKRLAQTTVFEKVKDQENPKGFTLINSYEFSNFRNVWQFYSRNYLDRLLTASILLTKSPKLYQLAQELYQEHQEEFLISAMVAALLSEDGETVFSKFSHYLVPDGKKAGRAGVMGAFALLSYDKASDQYVLSYSFEDAYLKERITVKEPIFGELDLRWLELLTDNKIKKDGAFQRGDYRWSRFDVGQMASWDSVLESLVRPNDEKSCALLGAYFYDRALYGKKGRLSDHFEVVRKCHLNFKPEVIVNYVKKRGKMYWGEFWQLVRGIPMTREDKIAAMEEVRRLAEKKEIGLLWIESNYLQLLDEI